MDQELCVTASYLHQKVAQLRLAARASHDPISSSALTAMANSFATEIARMAAQTVSLARTELPAAAGMREMAEPVVGN